MIWIVVVALLVAVNSALTGTFLVLRRQAMLGDAIAHAVLPGIVVSYLLAGSREAHWVLPAAIGTGVLCSLLISYLEEQTVLDTGTSTGVVFTALFAGGVVLLSAYAQNTELDQECVLYGELALVPFDQVEVGALVLPRAFVYQLTLLILALWFVGRNYKALAYSSFDPLYSQTAGIHKRRWQYALMALTSTTAVLSFDSVGALLIVAFLCAPAAAAWLLARSLGAMLVLSIVLGVGSALGGLAIAYLTEASPAAAMALCAGLIFPVTLAVRIIRLRKPSGRVLATNSGL